MRVLAAAMGIAATLALTACGNNDCPRPQSLGAVPASMVVPMPAPPPAPKPAPPPPPRPAPAAPKPPPPRPAPPAPKPPAPPRYSQYKPPPASFARPRPQRPLTYRDVYVQHHVDHTPLMYLLIMNGMLSSPPPPERCEQ